MNLSKREFVQVLGAASAAGMGLGRYADADAATVACDYPEYVLDKIASKEFMESGSPAADLVQNFEWTNDDQNLVAKYIAEDGMSQEEAAQKWIADNPDKVAAWIS